MTMDCLAPAMDPGTLVVGVLMDAACHLLNLNKTVTVHPDPSFEQFEERLVFSETEKIRIMIKVTKKSRCVFFYYRTT